MQKRCCCIFCGKSAIMSKHIKESEKTEEKTKGASEKEISPHEKHPEMTEKHKVMLQKAHEYHHGINGRMVDHSRAFALYEAVQREGGKLDGNALYNLGHMYRHGEFLKRNNAKAQEQYVESANFYRARKVENLSPIDWKNLGEMYINGFCMDKDIEKGVNLIEMAVAEGCGIAMWNLGRMYEKGMGKEMNLSEAVKYFKQSADFGYNWGMISYGFMFENSLGVENDDTIAFTCYKRAAENGDRTAMYSVGVYYCNGDGIEEADQDMALIWWKRAADLGDLDALRTMEELEDEDISKDRFLRDRELSEEDQDKIAFDEE